MRSKFRAHTERLQAASGRVPALADDGASQTALLRSRPKTKAPLRPEGVEAARQAGSFLRARGIEPELVCTTKTVRTQQTAEHLLEALGRPDLPLHRHVAGVAKGGKYSLEAKLELWIAAANMSPKTLLFVGHQSTQDYCVDRLPEAPAIPKDNRGCVLVYDLDDAGAWRFVTHFPGLAKQIAG